MRPQAYARTWRRASRFLCMADLCYQITRTDFTAKSPTP
jgi:hypothetical protein